MADLSKYQTKRDEGLETDSKTVVGAINELYNELTNKPKGLRVLQYKSNISGNFPTFNDGFEYEYEEKINGDGTYEMIVYAKDILPTSISFKDNANLLSLSYANTSNVKNMGYMFNGCSALTSLDVSSFDTTNVTNMSYMFNGCKTLTSLDVSSFDTTNVTSMSYMFYGCKTLTSLDLSSFNTTNVMNMYAMFNTCSALTSLDLSSFDTTNVKNMSYMFISCNSITDLEPPQNLKLSHDISSMTLLSAQEIVQWLNALPTVTDSPTITIGTSLSSKLTAEEIAIATNKGWVVS